MGPAAEGEAPRPSPRPTGGSCAAGMASVRSVRQRAVAEGHGAGGALRRGRGAARRDGSASRARSRGVRRGGVVSRCRAGAEGRQRCGRAACLLLRGTKRRERLPGSGVRRSLVQMKLSCRWKNGCGCRARPQRERAGSWAMGRKQHSLAKPR